MIPSMRWAYGSLQIRLQLMCYKYLWDTLVTNNFPTEHFFDHFGLNPQYLLSEDIRLYTSSLGFEAKTFEDVVFYFKNTCRLLSPSHERLLLRPIAKSKDSCSCHVNLYQLAGMGDDGLLWFQCCNQEANEESKSVTKASAMKVIKQRMEKDVDEVGKVARNIKTKLEEIDRDNLTSRQKSGCEKGTGVDRSRTVMTVHRQPAYR